MRRLISLFSISIDVFDRSHCFLQLFVFGSLDAELHDVVIQLLQVNDLLTHTVVVWSEVSAQAAVATQIFTLYWHLIDW